MIGRAWWVAALAVGCGKDGTGSTVIAPPDDTDTEPVDTDTGPPPPPPGPDLVLTDAGNYTLTQNLTIQVSEIRAKDNAAFVNWPTVTADMFGEPLLPAEVDQFQLLEVVAPAFEVPDRIERDDFGFDLRATWTVDVLGDTLANLDELQDEGAAFVPFNFLEENDDKTWVAALATVDAGGLLRRRLYLSLTPVTGAALATQMVNGSSSFTWSATLAAPLVTASGWNDYTFDWGDLENDALGKPYDKLQGDELFMAKLDGETPEQIALAIRDLEPLADPWYTMDVSGEDDALLSLARSDDGDIFPGFTEGSWVVGVRCTTCLTPFPLWLAQLEVVAP